VAFPGFGSGCGAGGSAAAAAGVYLKTPAPYGMNGLGLGMGVESLHPGMGYPPPSDYLYSEYKYSYRSEYTRIFSHVCWCFNVDFIVRSCDVNASHVENFWRKCCCHLTNDESCNLYIHP
jgi:hypothetical protein